MAYEQVAAFQDAHVLDQEDIVQPETDYPVAHSNDAPLVSVIVPVYNKERYLETMMECVLAQDVESLELICVDDCSTDGSMEVLERYAEQDDRVIIVKHDSNKGAGEARNTGVRNAKGQFLAFLDADDWYNDTSYLRRLCTGALNHGVLAAGASLCNIRTSYFTETTFLDNPEFSGYTFEQSGVVDYEDYQFDYGSPRFIYARSLFEDGSIRFDNRTFFEDPVVMVRALHKAQRFYADSHAQYMYLIGYRKPAWNTRKVLDLLEGIRLNLEFALENGLAKLYWITIRHLEWESYTVPLGIDRSLDVETIDAKLQEVELLIDRQLLAYLDPDCADFIPLLRLRMQQMGESGSLGRKASIEYSIRGSLPWHHMRAVRDKYLKKRR